MKTLTDKKLIQLCLDGNNRALEILISRHLKLIYSYVYKNVGSVSDAEDITQEVFIRVWKNLKKFDQKKSFRPWIFQIAKNRSVDFLRRKKTIPFSRFENEKGQNSLIASIAAAPLNLIEKISDRRVLSTAMQGLTDKEYKVINMRHDEGLSFKEIAQVFQESINTVKSRYRRTLGTLRKSIQQ